MEDIINCIDIGTSKVCAFVARLSGLGNVEILGKAIEPCSGVKKGVIVDIDSVSDAVRTCVQKLKALTNISIDSAYVNVMGVHVDLFYYRSSVDVLRQDHEITSEDIERLLGKAEKVKLPEDLRIIDIIPRQYIVDGCDGIVDPIGMAGVKLEVESDVVVGKITTFNNIVKSLEKANIIIDGFIAEALALGETALTPEEKEMGAVLIDIGGGVTNVSVFKNKSIVLYDSVPVGGDHITNDISIGLRISSGDADKLKREYGLALTSLISNDHEISVNELDGNTKKTIKVSQVVEIIEARIQEIFFLCKEKLEETGEFSDFSGEIVLAGGGISYMDGSVELAKEVFGLPARLVAYRPLGITNPEYLTSIAILRYVADRMKSGRKDTKSTKPNKHKKEFGILKRIAGLFNGLF